MNLGAIITSERGKAITKTGNEYINVTIYDEEQTKMLDIHISTHKGVVIYESSQNYFNIAIEKKSSGNLKHGKKNDWCNDCMSHGCKQL